MNRKTINKEIVGMIRFVYRMGIFRSILLCLVFLCSEEVYKVKWHGRDIKLRKGTTDFKVFKQVLVFEHYNNHSVKEAPAEAIIDLGANIGLSTLYYKFRYPEALVIAVEPEEGNFRMLELNSRGLKNVYCFRNAIWNKDTFLQLCSDKRGEYSYYVKDPDNDGGHTIQTITINDLVDQFHLSSIDLLKIDIEGAERELFTDNYLPWLIKVKSIVIELHDWVKPGCSVAFFRAISRFNYIMNAKGENVTILFENYGEAVASEDSFRDRHA